jgi:hypothetical protein
MVEVEAAQADVRLVQVAPRSRRALSRVSLMENNDTI